MSSPFGWDLPPGCTDKDINDHFGDPPMRECPTCMGDGDLPADELEEPELTWWQWIKNLFVAVYVVCPECNGDGEIVDEDEHDQQFFDEQERE